MTEAQKDAQDIFLVLKEYVDFWPATSKPFSINDYRSLKMYSVRLVAQGIPPEVVRSAMSILCGQEQYYPSLAKILSACEAVIRTVIGNRIMDADEAWSQIVTALKYGDKIDWSTHMKNAVDYLGGLNMISCCDMANVSIIRAHFRDGYNASIRREREKQEFNNVIAILPKATQEKLLCAGKTME